MNKLFGMLCLICLSGLAVTGQAPAQKKNSRPVTKATEKKAAVRTALTPVYFYNFTKPEFLVSKVHIEHDEAGIGLIRFEKKKLEEEFTVPIELSEATVELLKEHWENLGFLESKENYQSKLEYPHLGTMGLMMEKDGAERKVEFNWTDNKDVKALTDEYKKIGYEYVWKFELDVARRNQPLESPRIVKELDILLKRGQISDPPHILPYLNELSGDERMPLIARNHILRLAKSIGKKVKKEEKDGEKNSN
ncbi:MAG: hypothetical protein HKN33_01385 [Pyrinomonadaceae bacterium]|nr:hypothetical protein [Pyrinomonadaceae bacterium]